ncbi:hypothetical protein [Rhizobium sp. NLR22b]|uniref:hypothetical protein n=1 Tax=Rhizobium sp. NLR22b TaxID=2731115 RepID=UPI001C83A44D|nr:hypothetical protein [Rhizobium sp. NLR22b]MBX5242751.1 hypothetical protein [Rhizobium sp. NLR22b]
MPNEVDITDADADRNASLPSTPRQDFPEKEVAGTVSTSQKIQEPGARAAALAPDVQSRDASENGLFDNDDDDAHSLRSNDDDLPAMMGKLRIGERSAPRSNGKDSEVSQGDHAPDAEQEAIKETVAATPEPALSEHINGKASASAGISIGTAADADGGMPAAGGQSRNTPTSNEVDHEDEYGLNEDDHELAEILEDFELKDKQIRELAEQRLRIVQPVPGEEEKWRLIPPGQFEKENGHWPTKADYDAQPVLIKDGGMYMTKSQLYEAMLARCETPEQSATATAEFNAKMDEFGMSHKPVSTKHPVTDLLITHEDGQQTLQRRSPNYYDTRLSDLLEKYGRGNVALKCEDGPYRTVDAVALDRQSSPYKLSYSAEQLYKSYAIDKRPEVKAWRRDNEHRWSAVDPNDSAAVVAGPAQLLVRNPTTKSLLSPFTASQTIKRRPDNFEGKDYVTVLRDAGVDPEQMNSPNDRVSDVLVRTGAKTLLAGEKMAGLAAKGPLTEKFLKQEIYLQNYGTIYDGQGKSHRGPTGNFSTLESRERQLMRTYNKRPPAEQYARIYHSLEPSQQQQLNLPAPDARFDYLRVSSEARGSSTQATSRSFAPSSSQRNAPSMKEGSANARPDLSDARQMARIRPTGRAG